jgi:hypothetical protein
MRGRIVERHCSIEVRSPLREVAHKRQGHAQQAMANYKREGHPLLLGQSKELHRELANHVAIERHKVRDPGAVEERKKQQRIFGRLSKCFGLFDEETCSLRGYPCFRRSISFDMDEWGDERNLQLDLGLKVPIWSSARESCSMPSTSAERSSDRSPALPHRTAALSISPASV